MSLAQSYAAAGFTPIVDYVIVSLADLHEHRDRARLAQEHQRGLSGTPGVTTGGGAAPARAR
jgi:hypothetical protein